MRSTILVFALLSFVTISNSQATRYRSGIFLHHSTGAAIWGPNGSSTSIPQEITNYNTSHGYTDSNAVTMDETGWPITPWTNEWERWHRIFENQDPDADIRPYLESNKIIVIKSCFPSSGMVGEGGPADTLSPTSKTMYNYKWHWRKIVSVMLGHPDNFFVIWTNAPLVPNETNDNAARLSNMFCRWAKDTLASGNDPVFGAFPDNVYVFDFFHKLTGSDGKMLLQYASSTTDSHPNSSATELVAPQFVQEIFDAAIAYEGGQLPLPSVPTLRTPSNGVINQARTPLLKWRGAEHATTYRLQVSSDSTFATVTFDLSGSDTSRQVGPLADESMYFWRVSASNATGESDWTSAWRFTTAPAGNQYQILARWNLLSVPMNVSDWRVVTLFPTSTSRAYRYDWYSGYLPKDTLAKGAGFWLKFGYDQVAAMSGTTISAETVSIVQGWNMVGSISTPVATTDIVSDPGGIVTSSFFGFEGKYLVADSIRPGKGYWVKSNQSGKLILSSGHAYHALRRLIKIVDSDELPPPPPDEVAEIGHQALDTPRGFSLGQNYPNPFNPITDVRYGICCAGGASASGGDVSHVSLKVYDVMGREVVTLVDEVKPPGEYTVRWNASDQPSGVYFYRMVAGQSSTTKRMIIIR